MPDNKERRWDGERKWIKYRARLSSDKEQVAVNILEQSHRSWNFGAGLREDFRHLDYGIGSIAYPQSDSMFTYLRGSETCQDSVTLYMPLETYQKFKAAVLAYNEYFKGDSENS
jgi:hypothetical protein